jgi:hypothetical protein
MTNTYNPDYDVSDEVIEGLLEAQRKLEAENRRLVDFIESITDANGAYTELNGASIVFDAYKVLQQPDVPQTPTTGD